jgi:hypothetical protein
MLRDPKSTFGSPNFLFWESRSRPGGPENPDKFDHFSQKYGVHFSFPDKILAKIPDKFDPLGVILRKRLSYVFVGPVGIPSARMHDHRSIVIHVKPLFSSPRSTMFSGVVCIRV